MTIVNIEQNSPQWIAFRKDNKIGASDFPIILGLSPYKTALDLFREKLGFAESKYGPQMKFGHDMEDTVRKRAELDYECMFPAAVYQHEQYDWAIASLDGVCVSDNLILEIKTTNYNSFSEIRVGVVRQDWYAQVQWQMFVTGFPKCVIYAFYKGDTVSTEVNFDSKFIETNLTKAMEFHNCLVNMEPPADSEKDYTYIQDEEFHSLEDEYQIWYLRYTEAKQKMDSIKKSLEEKASGNCQGNKIRMTLVKRKGTVDWAALCEEERIVSEIVEEYRKPETEYYKITLKE